MTISSVKRYLLRFCLSFPVVMAGVVVYSKVTAPPSPLIPAPLTNFTPNGFDAYLGAAQSLATKIPGNQISSGDRRRAWIAGNTTAWQKMAEARLLPCRAPNMRGVTATFDGWTQLRDLARGQYVRTLEAKATGQWAEAAALGLDNVEMGINIEHGTNLLGSLVGITIQTLGHLSFEDIPSHLDASQAKFTTRNLESLLGTAQPFSQSLTEEKWNILIALNDYGKTGGKSGLEKVGELFLPHAKVNMATMMDEFIAEADKPTGAQKSVNPIRGLTSSFTDIYYEPVKKALFSDARRKANMRLLLTRLALRAYYTEHGAHPAQLSELAPTYLQKVPIDPFGKGESLRYRSLGNSYMAWSIGPDGVENNGVSIPFKPNQKRIVAVPESKGDIVVTP